MPGGYAASDSAATRPTASPRRHDLLRPEERLARRHRQLAPRRRRARTARAAASRSAALASRRPGAAPPTSRAARTAARPRPCRTPPRSRSRPPAPGCTSSCSRSSARQLVAARARAAHVDGEPQRVVGEHTRRARQALVQHVEPGRSRGSPRACRASAAQRLRRAARARATAAGRRAASSEALSSELGLVDSTSVTQRSTTSSSIRSPSPRWIIADCVRLPTILWVLEITRSAPSDERVRRAGPR